MYVDFDALTATPVRAVIITCDLINSQYVVKLITEQNGQSGQSALVYFVLEFIQFDTHRDILESGRFGTWIQYSKMILRIQYSKLILRIQYSKMTLRIQYSIMILLMLYSKMILQIQYSKLILRIQYSKMIMQIQYSKMILQIQYSKLILIIQ